MILKDIYDQLAYGELRLLQLGGDTIDVPGTGITAENYPRILPHVILGLTSLHTKCALKEGTAMVTLEEDVYSYDLGPTYTDILKMERVYGVLNAQQYEIPLNETNNLNSIRTPRATQLLLPEDTDYAPWLLETTSLAVKYRQNHPAIDIPLANASPLVTNIDLPLSHLHALCLFVASRLHNPIGMTPGAMHEGNNYAQIYEMEVAMLNGEGLEIDNDVQNDRLSAKGFC